MKRKEKKSFQFNYNESHAKAPKMRRKTKTCESTLLYIFAIPKHCFKAVLQKIMLMLIS